MKKKNNKKLARNAIRARKAVKKRENEQNTPKQRKRIATRIASLIGCLLLVSALVVPCFADPVINIDAPLKAYDYFKTQYLFNDANNLATQNVMNYWYDDNTSMFGNIGIFRSDLLVAGTLDSSVQSRFIFPENIEYISTSSINFDFKVNKAFSAILVNSAGTSQHVTNFRGEWLNATLSFFAMDYNDITLFVEFTDNGDYELVISFVCLYDDGDFLCSPQEVISYNRGVETWRSTFSSGEKLQVAFTSVLHSYEYGGYSSPYVPFIAEVMGLTLYHPGDYWVGWSNADSFYNGSTIYREAFDEGYDKGYKSGYGDGVKEINEDAFQEGYDRAVSEIESGDFGRNLLGSVFSAPLDALERFTLIKWETDSGKIVSISLIHIFSAIVGVALLSWFLKLFAGG